MNIGALWASVLIVTVLVEAVVLLVVRLHYERKVRNAERKKHVTNVIQPETVTESSDFDAFSRLLDLAAEMEDTSYHAALECRRVTVGDGAPSGHQFRIHVGSKTYTGSTLTSVVQKLISVYEDEVREKVEKASALLATKSKVLTACRHSLARGRTPGTWACPSGSSSRPSC